jgi:hypothetical protein
LETGTPGSEGRLWETDRSKDGTAPRVDPNHHSEWEIRMVHGLPRFYPPGWLDPDRAARRNVLHAFEGDEPKTRRTDSLGTLMPSRVLPQPRPHPAPALV